MKAMVWLVMLVAVPCGAQGTLAEKVNALIAEPGVARAHWGVAVTAMDGTPVFGLNEGQFFRPASNTKLFTTAAAMEILGPKQTFETKVIGEMDAATGVVEGSLVLVGGGDANFGSDALPYIAPAKRDKNAPKRMPLKDLVELADQLLAKGLKQVKGGIEGDDEVLPQEELPEAWGADDLAWGYGARTSGLSVADNQLQLTVTPVGSRVATELEQFGVAYYKVRNDIVVMPAGFKNNNVDVRRNPGSRELVVTGVMAVDAKPDVEEVSIDEPAQFAAMALRKLLVDRGVRVDGNVVAAHSGYGTASGFRARLMAPLGCEKDVVLGGKCGGGDCMDFKRAGTVLASHTSVTVAEDIVLTDKVSQNLHAEMLLRNMGRRAPCAEGTTVAGARMVRAFGIHAGIDPDDFVFFDGSGLSSHDLVTPRATAKLLSFAATRPWFAEWKAALPVGGVDGSLAARFAKSALKGHLFAKTGTLGESRALSGYVEAASGKTVIFSVMVDTHAPGSTADRDVMDKIVEAIAAAN